MSDQEAMIPILRYLRERFDDLHQVARGGMSRIFRGIDKETSRLQAIKVMLPDQAENPVLRSRFLREMRLLKKWHHPNLIAVLQTREVPFLWFSMEFLEGFSLAEHLERMGPLPWPEVVRIALDTLEGLEFIHAQGYIHRDLKPGNLLLTRKGNVRIADLGLAGRPEPSGLTRVGQIMGTLHYMPPELLAGEGYDLRGDLYALGLILFECLTGERYFRQVEGGPLREASCDFEATLPPDLPPELLQLLRQLTVPYPEDRVADARTAREMLAPLASCEIRQSRLEAMQELVTLDLLTLGPLVDKLRFLSRVPAQLRSAYFEEPEHLHELRLHEWEVQRRTERFRGQSDDTSIVGIDTWKLLAADLANAMAPLLENLDWSRVESVLSVAEVTVEALRDSLTWGLVRPVEFCFPELARRFSRDLNLVLPEEEVPLYGFDDLEAIRAHLVEDLSLALEACARPNQWVAVILQHRIEDTEWILEIKGRDLRGSAPAVTRSLEGRGYRIEPHPAGGVILGSPALRRSDS